MKAVESISIKCLFLFAFCIFLVNSVSAVVVLGGEWNSSNVIQDGETAMFYAYFASTSSSMDISIIMYDSSYKLIHSFEPPINVIEKDGFFWTYSTYIIDKSIYQTPGSFGISLIVSDSDGSTTFPLTLTVNPAPQPPPNNPPNITSTPITQINESNLYTYQVTATDADNDPLTFSLTQNPNWLSISSTGLITGTAPNVSADRDYYVTINVSDGKDFVTQAYTLTVKNIPTLDITPPNITILGQNPVTIEVFSTYTDAGATAWDDVDGNITSNIVIVNPVNVNVLGTYVITYDITDSSGNAATQITRTVNVVDIIPPAISILYPTNITYTSHVTQLNYVVSDNVVLDSCWYSLNGGATNSTPDATCSNFTGLASDEGSNTWTVYANDTSGNLASESITFTVQLPPIVPPIDPPEEPDGPSDKDGKKTKSAYTYEDIDEERYFEQLAQEKPKIELISEEPQPKKSWLVFVLGAILLVLMFGVIITLVRTFKTRK